MIDRVVGNRQRAMAARVRGSNLKIRIQLLRRFHADIERFAVQRGDSTGVRIQRELGVHQFTMILEKPVHSVESPAFLVGRESQDHIAVRLEILLSQTNERRDQDRVAALHVLRSTAVEVAVFFDKMEWIGGPILAARFDHVQVADDQNRFQRA